MKLAVTGGAGFIGQAVMRAAAEAGLEAWTFDHADGLDILGDLSRLKGADKVVHLAGMLGTHELFDDAERAVEVNVIGTLRILQWCARNDAGIVNITMPPVFESVYTATKMCADRLASAWHLFRGVPYSTVRAFNAYGPAQKHGPGHPQKIIPTFASLAWAGKHLPIWGDGLQTVDLVHVDDLGAMLVDAAAFDDGETFDGGTGVPMTVREVAELCIEVAGSSSKLVHLPMRDGEVPTYIAAKGDGWDLLHRHPTHDLDRLADTIRWYGPDYHAHAR